MTIVFWLMLVSSLFISLDLFGGILLLCWMMKKEVHLVITKSLKNVILFGIPLAFFIALVFRHVSFKSHTFDMTFVNQSLMHAFSGPILHSDVSINQSYFGEHLSFSFLPIGLFTSLSQSDILIMLIHHLLITLSVYFVVSNILKDETVENRPLYLFAFFMVLCSKTLKGAYLFDFREDSIAFAALLFCLYSIWTKRRVAYVISLIIAILSKENYSLICLFLPAAVFFDKDLDLTRDPKRFYIMSTFIICLAWVYISFKILIPLYTVGYSTGHPIAARFKSFGSTPDEILFNVLFYPKNWWRLLSDYILGWDRLKYLVYLFAPFILFSRKSWPWLIPAIPGILMNLLAPHRQHRTMGFHYDLMILPFIIFSFTLGLKKLKDYPQLILGLSLALLFSGKWPTYYIRKYFPTIDDIRDNHLLGTLDPKQVTAAGLSTLSHLNHIDHLREMKIPINNFDEFVKLQSLPHAKNRLKPIEASIWVVDNKLDGERKLKQILIEQQAKVITETADKRFTVLEFKYSPRQ